MSGGNRSRIRLIVDGALRGVDRAEDQVAGLGRVHGRVERLAVAHLAHQDDVGVLPHGVLQRLVPVDDVDADLALVDDATCRP